MDTSRSYLARALCCVATIHPGCGVSPGSMWAKCSVSVMGSDAVTPMKTVLSHHAWRVRLSERTSVVSNEISDGGSKAGGVSQEAQRAAAEGRISVGSRRR